MILERVGRQAQKGIDQSIVPNDCEQRLFVIECICTYDFRRRIWDADSNKLHVRYNPIEFRKYERILCSPGTLYDPLLTGWLRIQYELWHLGSIAKRIDDITQVFGNFDAHLFVLA